MVATISINIRNKDCAVVTRISKVTLQRVPPQEPHQASNFNVVDQLKKTPTQISLFELLRISPTHRAILDKALQDSIVFRDMDEILLQAMVGTIIASSRVAFTEKDIPTYRIRHNDPLHLEAYVHNKRIRRVLIDGGEGLDIFTLKLIKELGYSQFHIDLTKKINIKAYDDEERPSEGLVTLPIQIGPVTTDIKFQVLDKELGYNMLLGRP